MRPDCSVRIRPRTASRTLSQVDRRVAALRRQVPRRAATGAVRRAARRSLSPPPSRRETTERLSRSKREDLLKMHAYRDAIRGPPARMCCFPGTCPARRSASSPSPSGLGAFALRPTDGHERAEATRSKRSCERPSTMWPTARHRMSGIDTGARSFEAALNLAARNGRCPIYRRRRETHQCYAACLVTWNSSGSHACRLLPFGPTTGLDRSALPRANCAPSGRSWDGAGARPRCGLVRARGTSSRGRN